MPPQATRESWIFLFFLGPSFNQTFLYTFSSFIIHIDHTSPGFWSLPGIIIPGGFLSWDGISTHSMMFGFISGELVSIPVGYCPESLFFSGIQQVDRPT